MNFLFNTFNHDALGRRSLEDVVLIIAHQLKALGHKCGFSNEHLLPAEDGYTVVIEGFTPSRIKALEDAKKAGARFLCIATEEPTEKGFNHGVIRGMDDRQAYFAEAAKHLDAVLCLVPGSAAWYRQHAPAAQIELGYAPALVRPQRAIPDHDFGFYGSLSKRREKMLLRLARKMRTKQAVIMMKDFGSQTRRDLQMQRARVIIQIRVHEKMGLVSSSRCSTALHLGRPVVAEPHLLSKPWDEVVRFSESVDQFYDDAIATRAFWREFHVKQFDRFRDLLSPQVCIGRALDEVGIVKLASAA